MKLVPELATIGFDPVRGPFRARLLDASRGPHVYQPVVWTCAHRHDASVDAFACAEAEIGRRGDDALWHCTSDHTTVPCGACDGCRYDQARSPVRTSA